MSATIDERIVEMKFDNKQFGQGIQSTLSDIGKLNDRLQQLENNNAAQKVQSGFQSVNATALNKAIGLINSRFSAMGIMATTALQNITNSAMATGKKLVDALTIDPVKTGFQEYETQINAIQTISANTGLKGEKGIAKVNEALNNLNEYADKTIYNFTEMTRNIGTFTAAGIKLGPAVQAIKGIANLAAISGSTSQQASTAMYQLSQALASGTVNLQDWNSVVNAGMGGKVFQNALKRTAKQMGKTIDETKTFRESISTKGGSGWLDGEVLSETLRQLSGDLSDAELKAQGYSKAERKAILDLADTAFGAATKVKTFSQLWDTTKEAMQSGWTATWTYIVGDFNEAQELLSGISDKIGAIIEKFSDARNNVLYDWKNASALGGREHLIRAFKELALSIGEILKAIGRAFTSVFEGITGQQLFEATRAFHKFTKEIRVTEKKTEGLENAFRAFFQLLKIPLSLIAGVAKVILPFVGVLARIPGILFKILTPLSSVAFKLGEMANTALAGMAEKSYDLAVKMADVLTRIEDYVNVFVDGLLKGKSVFVSLGDVYMKMLKVGEYKPAITFICDLMFFVKQLTAYFGNATEKVKTFFSEFSVDSVKEFIDDSLIFVVDKIDKIITFFGEFFQSLGNNKDVTGDMADKFSSLGDAFKTLGDKIDIADKVDATRNSLAKLFDVISKFIGTQDLNSTIMNLDALCQIFFMKNLGKYVGSLGKINKEASKAVKQFGDIFKSLSKGIKAYARGIQATTLLKIAAAIGILVVSLVAISQIPEKDLWRAVKVLTGLAIGLVAAFAAITYIYGKLKNVDEADPFDDFVTSISHLTDQLSLLVDAAAFTVAAYGLGILADALGKMMIVLIAISKLDVSKLTGNIEAFIAVFGALAAMGAMAALVGTSALQLGVGMFAMSFSLKMMLNVFKSIADMDLNPWTLAKTITGFGAVLTAFAGVTAIASGLGSTASLSSGLSVFALAGSLYILIEAVKRLATISGNDLKKGELALAGLTACMSALMYTSQFTKGINVKSIAAIAVILGVLSLSLFILAKLPVKKTRAVVEELVILIGSVSVLCVALSQLNNAKSAITGVATIALVLGGLIGFFYLMKKLKLDDMLKMSDKLSSVLLSMTAISLAMIALGGFSTLAIGGAALFLPLVAMLAGTLYAIGELDKKIKGAEKIEKAIPILESLGTAIGAFFGAIIGGVAVGYASTLPLIGEALSNFMVTIKPFLNAISKDHSAALKGAAALAGTILALTSADLVSQLTNFLTGGKVNLTDFGEQLKDFAPMYKTFVNSLSDVSEEDAKKIAILAKSLKAIAKIGMIVSYSGSGGLKGLTLGKSDLKSFGETLGPFAESISEFADKAGDIDESDITSINTITKVAQSIINMANTIKRSGGMAGFVIGDNSLTSFGLNLATFGLAIKGYANCISGIDPAAIAAVPIATAVAQGIVNMANSINRSGGMLAAFIGDNSLASFGTQLPTFAQAIVDYATTIAGIPGESIAKVDIATAAARGIADLMAALPNDGGWLQVIVGGKSGAIKGLSDYLGSFGEAIMTYANAISGIGEEQANAIMNSVKPAKALGKVLKAMPRDEGLFQLFAGAHSFKGMSDYLGNLGFAIRDYSAAVSGNIDAEGINASITAIKKLLNVLKSISKVDSKAATGFNKALKALAKSGITGFTNGFKNLGVKVTKAVNGLVKKATSAIAKKKETLKKAGQKIGKNIASGIKDETSKKAAQSAGRILAKRAKTGAGSVSMFKTGQDAADGFIRGIRDRLPKAYAVGKRLHSSAERGSKKQGDTHSPSRAMMKIGRFFGEGFNLGIKGTNENAYASGRELARNSLDGVQSAIGLINQFLDDNIQLDPTIRPTLDLSDIQNGSTLLSSMLNDPILSTANSASRLGSITNRSPLAELPTADQFMKMLNEAITPSQQINPNDIYNAVRAGAQDANVSLTIGNREFNRHLRENGVRFRR